MPKEKYMDFINNKEKRDEFIRDFTNKLNDELKKQGYNKKYEAEDLIKNVENEKNQDIYKRCNEYEKRIDLGKDYARELCEKNNIKIHSSFQRHYFQLIDLPKEGDNLEEVEKKNIEILKSLSTEINVEEKLKSDYKALFDCDKTIFFPETTEEALENYEKNKDLIITSFIIKSETGFSNLHLPKKLEEPAEYFMSLFESGGNISSRIAGKSSEYSLFLPDDIPSSVYISMVPEISKFEKKYKEFDLSNKFTSFIDSVLKNEHYDLINKKEKEFFQKYDKNHDFCYKYTLGGKKFDDEFIKAIDEKREIIPIPTNYNVIEGFNSDFIESEYLGFNSSYSKEYSEAFLKEFDFMEIVGKEAVPNQESIIPRGRYPKLAEYYDIAKQTIAHNPTAKEYIELIDKSLEDGTLEKGYFNSCVKLIQDNVCADRIKSIDENGYTLKEPFESYKETGNPKKDIMNYYATAVNQSQFFSNHKNNGHYSKEYMDSKFQAIEVRNKEAACKNKIIEYLNLDKNLSGKAFYEAIMNSDKEIPENWKQEVEELSKTISKDYLCKTEFEKLCNENKNEKEKLEAIKESLEITNYELKQKFCDLESPLERAAICEHSKDVIQEEMKNNPALIKVYGNFSGVSPQADISLDTNISKEFKNSEFTISNSTKDIVLNACKKMKELGIFNENEINPELLNIGEEGTKVYGFRSFDLKQKELTKAISEGKIDEAYKKSQEVKEVKGKIHEMLDYIEQTFPQDGKHCQGNVGIFRNDNIPQEFKFRPQSQIQMNGLYLMMTHCHKSGYDLEDFINNPNKYIKDFYSNIEENKAILYKNNPPKENLFNALCRTEFNQSNVRVGRAFEFLQLLETDKKCILSNEKNQQYATYFISRNEFGGGYLFVDEYSDGTKIIHTDKIRDYLALGHEYGIENFACGGINYKTGEPNKPEYNYKEFLSNDKRSIEEVYSKTMEQVGGLIDEITKGKDMTTMMILPGEVVAATELFFKDYIKVKNLDPTKDKTALEMLKFIDNPKLALNDYLAKDDPAHYKKGESPFIIGYEEAHERIKEEMKSFNKEYNIFNDYDFIDNVKEYSNKNIQDIELNLNDTLRDFNKNLNDNMAKLVSVNEKYKSRNFFSKFFTRGAAKERKVMKKIKNEAVRNGFSKTELNSVLRRDFDSENISEYTKFINNVKYNNLETILKESVIENENLNKNNYTLEESKELFKDIIKAPNIKEKELKTELVRFELNSISKGEQAKDIQLNGLKELSDRRYKLYNAIVDECKIKDQDAILEYIDTLASNLDAYNKNNDLSDEAYKENMKAFEKMMKKAHPDITNEEIKKNAENLVKVGEKEFKKEKEKDDLKFEYVGLIQNFCKDIDSKRLEEAISKIGDNPELLQEKIDVIKVQKEQVDLSFILEENGKKVNNKSINKEKVIEKELEK